MERGPKIGPSFSQIHNALVAGFQGFPLSSKDPRTGKPKVLNASNTVTSSISGGVFPFLAFRTGTFTLQPWKDFLYYLTWDIPAQLRVQGPGEDGENSMRAMLLDILLRTNELMGLPVDDKGNTVAFGDATLRLFDEDKLTFLCDRGAPYIKTVTVNSIDDGLATADIVFHIESTLNLDPRTLKLMKVGVLGLNPTSPDGLYQDTSADEGRGIRMLFASPAETGYGGYNTSDPSLPAGFYSSAQNQPSGAVAAQQPSEIVTSVNATPYSASLSVGTPTQQLSAIAFFADKHSSYVTSLGAWSTSNAAVATVSASGLVTRVAAGTCSISCTFNGVSSNAVSITCT